MEDITKHDGDKTDETKDTSDAEMLSTADEGKEQDEKRRGRKRRRRREIIKHDDDCSNDDESGLDEPAVKKRELSYLGSPGPYSPGHSGPREPRSCVLSQRQKKKPLSRLLEQLLRNLEKRDQNQFFAWPVTDNYAPNYSTIIKKPMDFSTIKQKIDDNEYKSLNCFINDFKLMCNNAMKYNKPGTVYHKAARKLLHIGLRQLQPAKLRPMGNILTYMYEIPIRELGFDMGKMDVKALKHGSQSSGGEFKDNASSADDEVKLKMEAAREQHRKRLAKKAFPRMDATGYTSLKVLVDNDGMIPSTNQRPVSLGVFTGRIAHGTGTLQGFKEDRRNLVKGVKPLNYGAFGSYAPTYDSTFATLSKEDCHLLYHTYGEETGISSNENLLRFSSDSPWNCIYNMEEMFPSRIGSKTPAESSPEPDIADTKVDVDKLRGLSELGIDVDFLADVEEEITASQQDFGLKQALLNNLNVLRRLEAEQRERLSQPIPPHLSIVPKPTLSEQEIARTVVNNLKDMVMKVQPQHVAPLASVRKAMGVTLDHLDTPMSIDELNEISPEHMTIGDSNPKENGAKGDSVKSEKSDEAPIKASAELKQFISEFSTNSDLKIE